MKVHIGPYRKNRSVKIHIDDYDIWNMDQTLALIISPMLHKLKETQYGYPIVDEQDVPENLIGAIIGNWENDDIIYLNRWNYVLDEMIWCFDNYSDQEISSVSLNKENQNRKNNALYLFGKYFQNLWN